MAPRHTPQELNEPTSPRRGGIARHFVARRRLACLLTMAKKGQSAKVPECQRASGPSRSWHRLSSSCIVGPYPNGRHVPKGQRAKPLVARPGTLSHPRSSSTHGHGPTGQRANRPTRSCRGLALAGILTYELPAKLPACQVAVGQCSACPGRLSVRASPSPGGFMPWPQSPPATCSDAYMGVRSESRLFDRLAGLRNLDQTCGSVRSSLSTPAPPGALGTVHVTHW
jgi:hypothetical protein